MKTLSKMRQGRLAPEAGDGTQMKPEANKPEPVKAILAKPKDGESKEEFIKRAIELLRERGLLTEKSSEPTEDREQ